MISEQDRVHLERCVELAAEALAAGDEPFGSVLVSELGVPPSRVRALPIGEVISDTPVAGPDDELSAQVHELHIQFHQEY